MQAFLTDVIIRNETECIARLTILEAVFKQLG
jgi:hypothetical protein